MLWSNGLNSAILTRQISYILTKDMQASVNSRERLTKKPWFQKSSNRVRLGIIQSIYPYSVKMRENTDQKIPNTETFHAGEDSIYT